MSVYHEIQPNPPVKKYKGSLMFQVLVWQSAACGVVALGGFVAFAILGAFKQGWFDASAMNADTVNALFSVFHDVFIHSLLLGLLSFLAAGAVDYLDEKITGR